MNPKQRVLDVLRLEELRALKQPNPFEFPGLTKKQIEQFLPDVRVTEVLKELVPNGQVTPVRHYLVSRIPRYCTARFDQEYGNVIEEHGYVRERSGQ